jgi:hypothetical protein
LRELVFTVTSVLLIPFSQIGLVPFGLRSPVLQLGFSELDDHASVQRQYTLTVLICSPPRIHLPVGKATPFVDSLFLVSVVFHGDLLACARKVFDEMCVTQ